MEKHYDHKVEGIITRAKVRWFEEGEKSTKYFLNLEKRNYIRKSVNKLVINNTIITDPREILKEQRNFYKTLYSKSKTTFRDQDFYSFLEGLDIPTLSDNLRMSVKEKYGKKRLRKLFGHCQMENHRVMTAFLQNFIKPFAKYWSQCCCNAQHFIQNKSSLLKSNAGRNNTN